MKCEREKKKKNFHKPIIDRICTTTLLQWLTDLHCGEARLPTSTTIVSCMPLSVRCGLYEEKRCVLSVRVRAMVCAVIVSGVMSSGW